MFEGLTMFIAIFNFSVVETDALVVKVLWKFVALLFMYSAASEGSAVLWTHKKDIPLFFQNFAVERWHKYRFW